MSLITNYNLRCVPNYGSITEALTSDLLDAPTVIEELKECGIEMDKLYAQLLKEGVASFEGSFNSLLKAIEEKSKIKCNI